MTNRFDLKNAMGLVLLALSSAAAGCADHVKSQVVTCPCDRGICCASGVCADDQNACEGATQALSSASTGRWIGYVENYAFASGSDALDLTLHVEADGSLAGELIMGQGVVPAPPTDGTVGWPDWTRNVIFNGIKTMEGFAYRLINLRWTALRLQFDVSVSEPWGPWCRLQTPYDPEQFIPGSGGQIPWQCSPPGNRFADFNSGVCYVDFSVDQSAGRVPVDCGWFWLCGGEIPCGCTADGCDASDKRRMSFDIALRGDEGDGSTTYPQGQSNVRLIRASH